MATPPFFKNARRETSMVILLAASGQRR